MTDLWDAEGFEGQEATFTADENTNEVREFEEGDTIRIGSLLLTVPVKGVYQISPTGALQLAKAE